MRTLKDAPTYYALDPELEKTYVESAQKYYGFTPSMSFRQLIRKACLQRLQVFVGENLTRPELRLHESSTWDAHYQEAATRVDLDSGQIDYSIRTMSVDMSVEWGGNWGFYAMTSRDATRRLIVKFMAQYPEATLLGVRYHLHPQIDGYYMHYKAVESVDIVYRVVCGVS